jgi:multiple sugar transport system ATP-binding protein
VTEQLGSELVIGLKAADTTIMASRIAPETDIALHSRAPMWVDRNALHFFDRKTEQAIR